MAESKKPIIRRYEKNPILTKHDVPYPVETVHNAGVVKHNSKYVMLFRSHLRNGRSIIGLAESSDGLRFAVRPEPFITPAKAEPFAGYEAFGVEDPRICPMEGGYVHNVVFCCGAVAEDDGTVKIYWGGADSVMCFGTATIADLVDLCLSNPRPAL